MKYKGIKILMNCPVCAGEIREEKSMVPELKELVIAFHCESCQAEFEADVRHEDNFKRHFYFGRHSNPEYWSMEGIDPEEILNTFIERDKLGIPPYLKEYKMAELMFE